MYIENNNFSLDDFWYGIEKHRDTGNEEYSKQEIAQIICDHLGVFLEA